MARTRDLVARLLYGRPFSAVIPAERDGKLLPPQLIASRTEELRAEYGAVVDRLADVAAKVIESNALEVTMTVTQAIVTGRIPAAPELSLAILQDKQRQAQQEGLEIEWITLNPGNFRQGTHFASMRTGGTNYALEDRFFRSGEACLTAQFNGSVFGYREKDDPEGTHRFLAWVYEAGQWLLEPIEHLMIDEDELDLSYDEVAG